MGGMASDCGFHLLSSLSASELFFSPLLYFWILLKNENVQDLLNEIINEDKANRIIFEAIGTEKHWADVLRDAKYGDQTSFNVIMKLLEKRYLLDLPFVIARCLGKELFDEKMEKAFSGNTSVKKELESPKEYEEWNDDELNLFFI